MEKLIDNFWKLKLENVKEVLESNFAMVNKNFELTE